MLRLITLTSILIITIIACSPPPQAIDSSPQPIALIKPRGIWAEIRKSFKIADYSRNKDVAKQIEWLRNHKEDLKKVLANAAPYLYFVHHAVEERELPSEIALLPIIESAYDPFAYSHAGAAGLWQLMPGTAMGFGVKQNWWYDGRRDIYASTKTALDYLAYLNRYFDGNWLHALAAYDSGEGTVHNSIRNNLNKNRSTDFWSLHLPSETRAYIPRLLAIASIIKSPEKYGIELPEINDIPYFAEVPLHFQIDLSRAAKLAGISRDEIYKLNPGYNRWATSPYGPYNLVLPIKRIEQFKMNLASLPKQQRVKWDRYKVKDKDNLSTIAHTQKVKLVELMRANHLTDHIIHKNQSLIIPHAKTRGTHKRLNRALLKQNRYGPKKIEYFANKNERISKIAKKFNFKPAAIKFWNHLSGDRLKAKTKIVMWKSKSHSNRTQKYYIVQSGDNLGKIAHMKKITLSQLHNYNPQLKSKKFIKPNDKLRYA